MVGYAAGGFVAVDGGEGGGRGKMTVVAGAGRRRGRGRRKGVVDRTG